MLKGVNTSRFCFKRLVFVSKVDEKASVTQISIILYSFTWKHYWVVSNVFVVFMSGGYLNILTNVGFGSTLLLEKSGQQVGTSCIDSGSGRPAT